MHRQLVDKPRAECFLFQSGMSSMPIRPQECDTESIELERFAYVDDFVMCVRVTKHVARISHSAILTEFTLLLPRMRLRQCCTSELTT